MNLMTVKEVLAYLRISKSTLDKLVKSGKIKIATRIGTRQDRRFNKEDIDTFIETNK